MNTNNALKERYERLRTRSQALLEANPDIILRMDREGRYLDFHATDESKLVLPPERFLGRKASEIFEAEFARKNERYIEEVLRTSEMQIWEYPLTIAGETREYEARIVPSGENEVIAIIRDITEAKQFQEQLRLSESRLNKAQRMARIGNWERDIATNQVWCSDEAYRILGLAPRESTDLFSLFMERVHPEDRERLMRAEESAKKSGGEYDSSFRVLLPDGTEKVLEDHIEVEFDNRGCPQRLIGTVQDITERTRLEREVLSVSEHERQRIGRDLHDNFGQVLTGMSFGLKSLSQELERQQSPHVESVQRLTRITQKLITDIGHITRVLAPGFSSEFGLIDALIALAAEANSHFNVGCSAHCSYKDDVHDRDTATHLYRIAQEGLNNALRHSGAQNIELRFGRDGNSLILEIVDDGKSIHPDESRVEGMGLRNMRYRAHILRGRLEIERRNQGGTRVRCTCPG